MPVLICNFAWQGSKNCQGLFTHKPTQRGMCSVFNGLPLDQLVDTRASIWMQAFHKYYKAMPTIGGQVASELENVVETGISKAMKLILDLHQRYSILV